MINQIPAISCHIISEKERNSMIANVTVMRYLCALSNLHFNTDPTQHYIQVDVTVSECSNWPTNLYIEQPDGSHRPDWYNMFLGMDFSFFCQKGQTSFAFNFVAMKKCRIFSALAKLQAFNVNVNHPAYTAFCETCQG